MNTNYILNHKQIVYLSLLLSFAGCDDEPRTALPPKRMEPETVTVRMTVTAYANCYECCHPYFDGYTSSGHKIEHGDRLVAAPKNIPFGTMIAIPGYNNGKPVPVLDRGGSIKGNRLDVLMDSYDDAIQWGVQELDVTIGKKI